MNKIKGTGVYNLIIAGLFTALMVVSTFISIPAPVPFTFQIFVVFLSRYHYLINHKQLKYSLLSLISYVLLGVAGIPVFSGFQGGIGVLTGPTGGYILGFLFIVLTVGIARKFKRNSNVILLLSMGVGLAMCYLFGSIWYGYVTKTDTLSAFAICVLPYVIFDVAKLLLAFIISKRLKAEFFAQSR